MIPANRDSQYEEKRTMLWVDPFFAHPLPSCCTLKRTSAHYKPGKSRQHDTSISERLSRSQTPRRWGWGTPRKKRSEAKGSTHSIVVFRA